MPTLIQDAPGAGHAEAGARALDSIRFTCAIVTDTATFAGTLARA